MLAREVELYAILVDGRLNQYPEVRVAGASFMPSGGALSNPNDRASIQGLEDTMIEAYGNAVIVNACKAGGAVDLSRKMLRAVHMEALGGALEANQVTSLNLQTNQLGGDAGTGLAKVLESNSSLTEVRASLDLRHILYTWCHLMPPCACR